MDMGCTSYVHHKELQEDFLEGGSLHFEGAGMGKERRVVQEKGTVCRKAKAR
jgi:hypothetical protein